LVAILVVMLILLITGIVSACIARCKGETEGPIENTADIIPKMPTEEDYDDEFEYDEEAKE